MYQFNEIFEIPTHEVLISYNNIIMFILFFMYYRLSFQFAKAKMFSD